MQNHVAVKFFMAQFSVEALCVLYKTEPGHWINCLSYTPLQWCGARHWRISQMLHFVLYVQWLLVSGGIGRGTRNTGGLHSRQKANVQCDACGGTKCISTICGNYNEATKGMRCISKWAQSGNTASKYFLWCVTVWTHIRAAPGIFKNIHRHSETLLWYT